MPVKILAADDSATMRRVLEMTFAGEAVELVTVDSGEAAVERASHSPPDVIIADASMAMSGYDVARAIKGNAATQQVAVIVLASQHTPFDSAKAKESGVDDHLLKPYDSQAMIDKAKEVLSRPRATVAGGAKPVAAATRPSSPGVGRPASSSPSQLRSTVSFGTPVSERPVLELAEDDPPPARPAKPAVPKLPPRPPMRKPVARSPLSAKPAASPLRPAAKPAPRPAARPAAQPTPPAAQPTPATGQPMVQAAVQPTASAAAAATAAGAMAAQLAELDLTQAQIEGVLALSKDVIEKVVWEVVPDLAEAIILEEIRRLTAG